LREFSESIQGIGIAPAMATAVITKGAASKKFLTKMKKARSPWRRPRLF
jgi:hypothetical protein